MHCTSQYASERGSRWTLLLSWTWSLDFSSKWLEDDGMPDRVCACSLTFSRARGC